MVSTVAKRRTQTSNEGAISRDCVPLIGLVAAAIRSAMSGLPIGIAPGPTLDHPALSIAIGISIGITVGVGLTYR